MHSRSVRALVVDDSPQVRALISLLLRRSFGYVVTAADCVEEALQLFEAHPYSFDAAFLDYEIGWQSGVRLLERMRQLRPDLRVLMLSASPESAARDLCAKELSAHVLGKPFTLAVFRAAVDALGAAAPAQAGTPDKSASAANS